MKIAFDTTTDTLAAVLAVTHAAFGVAAEPAAASAAAADLGADNPAAGIDVTQRDKDGMPWDVRVHSTPAKMNADGTWKAKRGRSDAEYAAVRAEYATPPAATQGAVTPPPAAADITPPPAAGITPPPATLTPPPAATITPYQRLFDYLAAKTAAGRAPVEWIKESLEGYQVQDGNILNLQSADPKFVEELHAEFVKVLGE